MGTVLYDVVLMREKGHTIEPHYLGTVSSIPVTSTKHANRHGEDLFNPNFKEVRACLDSRHAKAFDRVSRWVWPWGKFNRVDAEVHEFNEVCQYLYSLNGELIGRLCMRPYEFKE